MHQEIELGERVLVWREHRGLTQAALAAKMGVSPAAVAQWELNQTAPTQSNLQRLADALQITLARFWGRVPKRRESKAS